MSETVEVKIWDLEGAALNWAVAMAEGEEVIVHDIGQYRYDVRGGIHCCKYGCTFGPRSITEEVERYEPSDSWAPSPKVIADLVDRYRPDIVIVTIVERNTRIGILVSPSPKLSGK
ncbi:hypothetical protein MPK9_00076 [Pseudomonas phage MPK9]